MHSSLKAYESGYTRCAEDANAWIDVVEFLPKNGSRVIFNSLVYGVLDGEYRTNRSDGRSFRNKDTMLLMDRNDVTHWQLYPIAPLIESDGS